MKHCLVITGRLCTGKSGLAVGLRDEFGYYIFKTSDILKTFAKERDLPNDRIALQKLGTTLDEETNYKWVYDHVIQLAKNLPAEASVVVDNVRSSEQLEHFRSDFHIKTVHVHLYANDSDLLGRFSTSVGSREGDNTAYGAADILRDEEDIEEFKRDADVRIYTTRSDANDTLVRVAARLGLYSSPMDRCVDVLVGGQYGSEGKGHIAAYLSRDYDVLVRVGGPNAGHTVSSPSGVYTYHQLPSGSKDTNAILLLGPGMTINVSQLLEEIADCGVTADRLFIDPQAMVIAEQDIRRETGLVSSMGSTGRGGGAAAARRILNRKPGQTRLARNVPELRPYVGEGEPYRGSTVAQLERAYRQGCSVLLEGTQGSALSLYHGAYPFVTSRDTNVAGCLAEAGISPSRVRRILMVVRSTPIRVGNPEPPTRTAVQAVFSGVQSFLGKQNEPQQHTSGPLKHETTFEQIAIKAGIDPIQTVTLEITSTTKRKRRVGWFDWEQFRNACNLNAPTDIVLTFADYVSGKNREARRFDQLDPNTIKFVEELEQVAQAPVSLINTRFQRDAERIDLRSVIDRRTWATKRVLQNKI